MNSTPASIGILAPNRTAATMEVLDELMAACAAAGLHAYEIGELTRNDPLLSAPDLVLCLGGDGTMLSAAKEAAQRGVILGGLNMGHLGFLSACGRDEMQLLVDSLVEGTYCVEERAMIEARRMNPMTGLSAHNHIALNELALMRARTGKMIDVDVEVDGKLLNRYHADGILVATPTGSTAYSLSAGGPLIWPTASVICLTPICPHSLTNRSLTLPDNMEIVMRPRERRGRAGESLIYSLDGRSTHDISPDETLTIRKAEHPLRLLSLPHSDFAQRLRAKLKW